MILCLNRLHCAIWGVIWDDFVGISGIVASIFFNFSSRRQRPTASPILYYWLIPPNEDVVFTAFLQRWVQQKGQHPLLAPPSSNVGAEYLYPLVAIPREFPIVNTCPLGGPMQPKFLPKFRREFCREFRRKKGNLKYVRIRPILTIYASSDPNSRRELVSVLRFPPILLKSCFRKFYIANFLEKSRENAKNLIARGVRVFNSGHCCAFAAQAGSAFSILRSYRSSCSILVALVAS